jgi:hypothetical protein
MHEEFIPTLLSDLTSIPWRRIKNSPELLAITALDANLFSTINILKSNFPYLGEDADSVFPEYYTKDDHIAELIISHSQILRRSLAAYYLYMRDRGFEKCEDEEISF